MSETKEEYFERQLKWEESFETIEDFISTLNNSSNASGSLGRIAAKTIVRLQKEVDRLKGKRKDEER